MINNMASLKKQKQLPGHIDTEVFDVSAKYTKIKGRVNPSLEPVGPPTSDGNIVREVLEFGVVQSPSLAFESLLYIYPETLTAAVKAKELNVQVRVSCERDPDDVESHHKFFGNFDVQLKTTEVRRKTV